MSRARVVVAGLAVAVLARAEGDGEEAALPAEEDDEARCGSGPFEPCGFFYDVVPWWHLISPLFVLVVLPPVVRWCLKNRARFTGWATLARKYECGDDWPAGTRELGVAAAEVADHPRLRLRAQPARHEVHRVDGPARGLQPEALVVRVEEAGLALEERDRLGRALCVQQLVDVPESRAR